MPQEVCYQLINNKLVIQLIINIIINIKINNNNLLMVRESIVISSKENLQAVAAILIIQFLP